MLTDDTNIPQVQLEALCARLANDGDYWRRAPYFVNNGVLVAQRPRPKRRPDEVTVMLNGTLLFFKEGLWHALFTQHGGRRWRRTATRIDDLEVFARQALQRKPVPPTAEWIED